MPQLQTTDENTDPARTNGTSTVAACERLSFAAERLNALESGLRDRNHHIEPEAAKGYALILSDIREEIDSAREFLADA